MNGADPLATLADIELPAPPDWRPLIAAVGLLLLFAAWALVLYIRARKRDSIPAHPRPPAPETGPRAALAQLEQLRLEWCSGVLDARTAAYRIGALLRLGLDLPQLLPAAPPAGLDDEEWRETLQLLQSLRYPQAPAQALPPELFDRAQRWLGRHEPRTPTRDV